MKEYLGARRKTILIGFLLILITSLPYLLGFSAQGEDFRFTGFLIGVEDGNSYIAKMLSGAAGNWLFRSPYSAENQRGALIFLPYLLLGKLTAGPAQHEQLVVLFQAYRCLALLLVTFAVDDFLALFITDNRRRILALGLTLTGGGLGWAVAIAGMKDFLGSIPLDFLSPESFGFLGIFGLPHLAISRALMFWGLAAFLKRDNGYGAGMLWLLMGFFQPMNIVIIWIVCGAVAVLEFGLESWSHKRKPARWAFPSSTLKKTIQAGLISSPILLYNLVVFSYDPYLAAWTAQNRLPSPHWGHYLIAYGPVIPLAIAGIREGIIDRSKHGLVLAVWLGISPFLVYAPVNPQRRLAEGIWIILITGMFIYFEKRTKISLFGKLIIASLLPTTLFLLWGASNRALEPAPPSFLSAEKVAAYQGMAELAPVNSIVLSSFEVGNSLPAWAPVRVVMGHGPESVHLESWKNEIEIFFIGNQGREDCGDFFYDQSIDYVFWGPEEEQKWDWDPEIKTCLSKIYNSKSYQIFQVDQQ